ncbi:hypothetical protein KCU92_g6493, partial [Aureobasidium melanogenum]
MEQEIPPVPSTREERDVVELRFNFDVIEDFQEKVGYMAYKSTLGQFSAARAIADSITEKQLYTFPVAFEKLRLFYDQGHYGQLLETINNLKRSQPTSRSAAPTEYQGWSEQESEIVELMQAVAETENSMRPRKSAHLESLFPIEIRFAKLHWVELDEEDVILAVLNFKLGHLERERAKLASFLYKIRNSLTELLSPLLQHQYFWCAEKLLETCMRGQEDFWEESDFDEFWPAIAQHRDPVDGRQYEWFSVDSDDERQTWAKIGILQTFYEGCLRRDWKYARRDPGRDREYRVFFLLSMLVSELRRKQGDILDNQLWEQSPGHWKPTKETTAKLINLANIALKNDDVRPRDISTPREFVSVPFMIYLERQDILDRMPAHEVQRLFQEAQDIGRPLVELCEPMRKAIAAAKKYP